RILCSVSYKSTMNLYSRISTLPVAAVMLILLGHCLYAQDQHCRDGIDDPNSQPDPRDPGVQCMPELGRQLATLPCSEFFGLRIVPLGRLGHDTLNSWAVEHTRCDTTCLIP